MDINIQPLLHDINDVLHHHIKKIVREQFERFSEAEQNFDSIKKFIDEFHMPLSKPQRNLVAGYIARKKAQNQN